MKLKLGPGGTAGLGYEKGIPELQKQGLSALEVEFTYGVNIKEDMARKIGELAKKHNIKLSVHAPYYVNLASDEKAKRRASAERIIQSCRMASIMGAKYVVFHPGFYQKKSPEEAFEIIKEELVQLLERIKENDWNVSLAPETTGKPTQFGSVDELMKLHKETGCHVCVDFAHLKARSLGEVDFFEVIEKIKPLGHIHSHFSGIEWTDKGEKKHLITEKEVIRPLAEAIVKNNLDITIINESPTPIDDAVKMKEVFEKLKG